MPFSHSWRYAPAAVRLMVNKEGQACIAGLLSAYIDHAVQVGANRPGYVDASTNINQTCSRQLTSAELVAVLNHHVRRMIPRSPNSIIMLVAPLHC